MKPETEAWIDVAEVDYRLAVRAVAPPDPIYEGATYHAQQCLEKYLRALLDEADRAIPRTHDLGHLYRLTADLVPAVAGYRTAIERIAPYATELRYPHAPVGADELAQEADAVIAVMEDIRSLVRTTLQAAGS